ncbi:DinB family protein [Brevibacillus humidisoli]|uniref:DinB family protein n=1 Tax=Brevibacillus humidisoli TaxID=2895522 RepID=UPI001E33DE8E|nr:DinB family protein [Brevibacillus humidisoli]UFJ43179.1 DinB family protein [Brevibacillus humidisoli]
MELQNLRPDQIILSLQDTMTRLEKLLRQLPESAWQLSIAPGKWTVAEIVGHLYDTEEVWGGRIEKVCHEEKPDLPGYDPESYVRQRGYKQYNLSEMTELLQAYRQHREKTLALLQGDVWRRVGVHLEEGEMSVQVLTEILALHEQHHLQQIEQIWQTAQQQE